MSATTAPARVEFVSGLLEAIATTVGKTPDELIKLVEEFHKDKTADLEAARKAADQCLGRLPVAFKDRQEDAVKNVCTIMLLPSVLGEDFKVGDTVSLTPLSLALMIQAALSVVASQPTAAPVTITSSSTEEVCASAIGIVIDAVKNPLFWRSVSLHVVSGNAVQVAARRGSEVFNAQVLVMQLLQTFRGVHFSSSVKHLCDFADKLAETTGLSPLCDAIALADNVHKVNHSGFFHPGFVNVPGGLLTTATCSVGKRFGACSTKSLQTCLAVIPTGPFCCSHNLSTSPASAISLHATLTLGLLHSLAIVFSESGCTSQPIRSENVAQGCETAGTDERFDDFAEFIRLIDDQFVEAATAIRNELSPIFGDSVSMERLSTLNCLNIPAKTPKRLTLFIRESITVRAWFLRMLNMFNKCASTFDVNNFTRESIVASVFGSSTLLSMMMNFNGSQASTDETLAVAKKIFPSVSDAATIVEVNSKLIQLSSSEFVKSLLETDAIVDTESVAVDSSKLETVFSIGSAKTFTSAKTAAKVVSFLHGPIIFGTNMIATSRAPAGNGKTANTRVYQMPADEVAATIANIEKEAEIRANNRGAAKAASGSSPVQRASKSTKTKTTTGSTRATGEVQSIRSQQVVSDSVYTTSDAKLQGFDLFAATVATQPKISSSPAPRGALVDSVCDSIGRAVAPQPTSAAEEIITFDDKVGDFPWGVEDSNGKIADLVDGM